MDRLPNELLLQIFGAGAGVGAESDMLPFHDRLASSRVCWHWRRLLLPAIADSVRLSHAQWIQVATDDDDSPGSSSSSSNNHDEFFRHARHWSIYPGATSIRSRGGGTSRGTPTTTPTTTAKSWLWLFRPAHRVDCLEWRGPLPSATSAQMVDALERRRYRGLREWTVIVSCSSGGGGGGGHGHAHGHGGVKDRAPVIWFGRHASATEQAATADHQGKLSNVSAPDHDRSDYDDGNVASTTSPSIPRSVFMPSQLARSLTVLRLDCSSSMGEDESSPSSHFSDRLLYRLAFPTDRDDTIDHLEEGIWQWFRPLLLGQRQGPAATAATASTTPATATPTTATPTTPTTTSSHGAAHSPSSPEQQLHRLLRGLYSFPLALRHLEIEGNANITELGVFALVMGPGLPHLQSIEIRQCTNVVLSHEMRTAWIQARAHQPWFGDAQQQRASSISATGDDDDNDDHNSSYAFLDLRIL